MAQWCPRVDPLRPPQLPRDQPGLLKYGATCMPGTATAGGCSDSQKYWAVVIPWADVAGPQAWLAPGGNRYWASFTPLGTPAANAILRLMAERSRMHTQNVFKNWREYRDLTMAQVMAKTQGKLALDYGVVHVEIRPDPNETAANFARRGGYMLWIDPATGAFTSRQPIDWYKPSWLPGNVETVQLWGYYRPGENRVEYSVRVRYEDTWEKVVRAAAGGIEWGFDKFCATITGEKAQQARVAVDMYKDLEEKPKSGSTTTTSVAAAASGNPYAAAWAVALAGCARYMAPPPPCEPRPDQPLPASPIVTATTGWKSQTASGASNAATIPGAHALDPRIVTGGSVVTPPTPQYPTGSIAWYDSSLGGYRIAIPRPGDGTTHVVLTAGALKAIPAGVSLVSKHTWEKATLPFWRRSSTKIGIAVGGVAAASLATVLATR